MSRSGHPFPGQSYTKVVNQYSFASNWQLLYLERQQGENNSLWKNIDWQEAPNKDTLIFNIDGYLTTPPEL